MRYTQVSPSTDRSQAISCVILKGVEKRAHTSVAVLTYGSRTICGSAGFSPIFITAALSVLVLLAAIGWEVDRTISAQGGTPTAARAQQAADAPAYAQLDPQTATSADPLDTLGPTVMQTLSESYAQLRNSGTYSSSTAVAIGTSLAPYLVAGAPYPAITVDDVRTDPDTSYQGMLRYRTDLRSSLAPLLNNTEPEYEIFAYYIQTKDASYLRKLRNVAEDYRAAASSTSLVVAPKDAASYHAAIVNAMQEFAATLDALAAHADDPYASAALLSGYNKAESTMLTSFNSLTTYYKSKLP